MVFCYLLNSMDFITLVLYFLIIVPSAIIHEYAHGWMADRLGDPTARIAGRLTLNPVAHIDLFGTILLPVLLFIGSGGSFLFAYAKPVPYNPFNLEDKRWDPVRVALAGPTSNIILAVIFGSLLRFGVLPETVAPLAGIIVFANILLAVFNMVPIPPLDGSKLLFALLPDTPQWEQYKMNLERYGFIVLLFFVFYAFHIISPIIGFLYNLFTGGRFY